MVHKSSNKDSIERVYSRNRSSLAGLLRGFLDSSHDIEDMMQEAFLKAYQAERSSRIKKPQAFLFRTARNLAINEIRRRRNHRTDTIADPDTLFLAETAPDTSERVIAQDFLERALNAINQLTPRVREVFLLAKIEGQTRKQIASSLGITVATVDQHIASGVAKMLRHKMSIQEGG